MPLLDHFHPPLSIERPWEGIHSTWATTIATQLNQDQLPAEYFAMPLVTLGGGAPIELVSPANKDRASHGRAFAVTCAGYLQQGVAVIIVDVVTERTANLHVALADILGLAHPLAWGSPSQLYAVAYRPTQAAAAQRLEAWPEALAVGAALPTMPLWLSETLCLPLTLEVSYQAACAALRIRV